MRIAKLPVQQENGVIATENQPAKLILQHSGIYLATRLLGAGLQLGLLVILTRLLTPGSYGKLALFTAAYSFLAVLMFNPWRQSLTRFWPLDETSRRVFQRHFVVGILSSNLIITGTFLLLFGTGFLPMLSPLALGVAAIAGGWTDTNLEMHRRMLKPARYMRLFLARSFSQLVLMGVGAAITGTANGAIAGLVASHLLAVLLVPWRVWQPAFAGLMHGGRHLFIKALPDLKKWLVFALPLAAAEFVALAMVYTDRIMIAATLGVEQTGLYSAVHDLAWMGLHMVSLIAFLAFYPLVLQQDDRDDHVARRQALSQGFTLLFGLSLPATVGLAMLAAPVTQLVLGAGFNATPSRLMIIIAVVHLVYAIKIYWIDLGFSLARQTWPLLIIGFLAVLANIGLNAVLVPRFAIEGAAMATGLASLGSIVLTTMTAMRMNLARYPVIWRDILKIIAATGTMALAISILPEANSLVWLAIRVIGGAGAFVAAILVFRLSLVSGIFQWMKKTV